MNISAVKNIATACVLSGMILFSSRITLAAPDLMVYPTRVSTRAR